MEKMYYCDEPQLNQRKGGQLKSISKILFLLFLFIGWGGIATSQTVQIGSGTATNAYFPIYATYEKGYCQTIYTSDELLAAGVNPSEGLITKIRFKATTSQSTVNWQDWTIYLGNTSQEGFADGNDWIAAASINEVFSGQIASNVVAGQWLEITLDNSFQWDGTSNIVVAVNQTTGAWGNTPNWAGYTLVPTTGSKGIYKYRDGTDLDPINPITGTVTNKVAQIQFDGDLQTPCVGTPTAGTITTSPNICAGSPLELKVSGLTTGASGLIGQWQSHEVGSSDPWIDVVGGTTNPYTVASADNNPTEYRYILSCGSDADTTIIMTTSINPATDCYCTPTGASNNSDEIINFTLNNLNNTSAPSEGTDGYSDYTTSVAPAIIERGTSYIAELTSGSGSGNHGAVIWIDTNDNGLFEAAELFASISSSIGASSTVDFPSFTIPLSSAVSGLHRLRVQYTYNQDGTSLDPCTVPNYSETEDYMVKIVVVPDAPTIVQASGTPDCVSGTDLTTSGTPPANVTWYWQEAKDSTDMVNDASATWTVFENGTYYVKAYDSFFDVWSKADSIEITNMPAETTPLAPLAGQNPACLPGTQITMDPAPTDVEYYWQGTSSTSSSITDNASAPYDVTATGTYYVKAYNTITQCWSESIGTTIDVGTIIPDSPVVDSHTYNFCSGVTSAEISGSASYTGSETKLDAASGGIYSCNGSGGGVMFNITNDQNVDITITALDALLSANVNPTAKVFYKTGTYEGSEENQFAWTLLGEYTTNGAPNSVQYIDVDDLVLPAGETFGIYLHYEAQISGLSSTQTYTDGNLTITSGSALCGSMWGGINELSGFNGSVYYLPPVSTDIKWYDAATGGNVVGSTNPLETIGTTVIPSGIDGTYEFFAASDFAGCESVNRELVTVNISPVNVSFNTIDATCSNGDNGSFAIDNVVCGTSPFTFSVDGGAFGGAPNDLTAGDHTVVVKDNSGDESGEYTITIGSAAGPSDVTIDGFTNQDLTVSWTPNGSETSWNIEWGAPGFVPGTNTELGSAVVTSSPYTITGLDSYTDYYVYVSANCGGTTTPGDWDYVLATTDCDAMAAIGFCENFEDDNSLYCWRSVDNNNDGTTWGLYINNANSGVLAAGIETDDNPGNNDDYYIMPQMNLTGTESLNFFYNTGGSTTNYQIVLSTTGRDPADFTTVIFEDTVSNSVYKDTSVDLTAYTGNVYIAFYIPTGAIDGDILLIDDVCIDDCSIAPGTNGSTDVCRADGTVDLGPIVTLSSTDGNWAFPSNPNMLNGTDLDVSTISSGAYQAYYIVKNVCTSDTTIATVNVYGPSTAGDGNTIHACKYAPLDLFSALSGNADLGGSWYDYNGNLLPNSQPTTPGIQASYNYRYIVSNGVCAEDTSIVEVIIDNCVWVGLDEEAFTDISVYPNPATDQINIVNPSNTSNLKVRVLDMNGRVVLTDDDAMKNTSKATIAIDKLSKGIYTLRIYNDESQRIFKVVKQ